MIDPHAHLTDERFAGEVEAVIQRAVDAGVEAIVTIGTDRADSEEAQRLAAEHAAVFASVGIHPHAAGRAEPDAMERIRELASLPRVVALGETGLDYHYDFSPRPAQRELFLRHLELGSRLDLPVVVHSRESDEDLAAILAEAARGTRGVLHCFAGSRALLEIALEIGWYISFAGMITFRRYDDAELVRAVPSDRLLVETDSPYLAPVPNRGKRNEPAWVTLVAARAAELRGEDGGELAAATAANARRLFRLPG